MSVISPKGVRIMGYHAPKGRCLLCGRVLPWGRVLCRPCRERDPRLTPLTEPLPRPVVAGATKP